ncbi:transcriptional repressor [Alphaproteobacteria bacterium]|nr:transcriptional repressor [Alphaproteobacteria bacterium]
MKQKLKDVALKSCMESGAALTPSRLAIFEMIASYDEPVTAYALQSSLNAGGKSFNIATVYRVLEFWCNIGLVHKIASLNKFRICQDPDEVHTHIMNVCTQCGTVFESCNERMGLDLNKGSAAFGMTIPANSHVEIPVICKECH